MVCTSDKFSVDRIYRVIVSRVLVTFICRVRQAAFVMMAASDWSVWDNWYDPHPDTSALLQLSWISSPVRCTVQTKVPSYPLLLVPQSRA